MPAVRWSWSTNRRRSPGLDIGRWAHDATILALPTRILCRADCAGLCPVCGESLNDNPHEHEAPTDDRWAALKNLKLD
ncbi:MAG TPA: DUF177 domain-containing protein [Solirubrobacterales bacterium]